MLFSSEKCSPQRKIEPLSVVLADLDYLPDRSFVRSHRSFPPLTESIHSHLLSLPIHHGKSTFKVALVGSGTLTMRGAANVPHEAQKTVRSAVDVGACHVGTERP